MNENLTPKQKAFEMIEKYQSFEVSVIYKDLENDTAIATDIMTTRSAIECAIIGVGWIIDRLSAFVHSNKTEIDYWKSVIVELKNMQSQ